MAEAKPVDESETLVKKILFFKNPYDKLDVRPTMSSAAIKRRYRQLTLKVHPDKCHHPKAAEAMDALTKALAVVQDPEKRRPYEEVMRRTYKTIEDAWIRKGKKIKVPKEPQGKDEKEDEGKEEEDEEDESEMVECKDFMYEWRKETHRTLVELEEQKKRAEKMKLAEEKRAQAEEEEERKERVAIAAAEKRWDEGRDKRVDDWRKFMSKGKKRSRESDPTDRGCDALLTGKYRPPKLKKEERY